MLCGCAMYAVKLQEITHAQQAVIVFRINDVIMTDYAEFCRNSIIK